MNCPYYDEIRVSSHFCVRVLRFNKEPDLFVSRRSRATKNRFFILLQVPKSSKLLRKVEVTSEYNEIKFETVNLTICDREPIHLPNLIQKYELLMVLTEPDLRIAELQFYLLMLRGTLIPQTPYPAGEGEQNPHYFLVFLSESRGDGFTYFHVTPVT